MHSHINLVFSQRDRTVLHALPAVLWMASCLYAILTQLQALPPGLSADSPVSLINAGVLAMCILLSYPVYRLAYISLKRIYPDWLPTHLMAIVSLAFVGLGGVSLVAMYLLIDTTSGQITQINSRWFVLNLMVGMLLMPVFFFILRGTEAVRDQISAASRMGSIRNLLRKLGPDSGNKLVRLQSADHYVEVHTDTGAKLLLMRLSDATEMLSGTNGQQVHRSHWVNLEEVKGVIKRNRKIWLRMSDGSDVPVSRSYSPALRKAGVL